MPVFNLKSDIFLTSFFVLSYSDRYFFKLNFFQIYSNSIQTLKQVYLNLNLI